MSVAVYSSVSTVSGSRCTGTNNQLNPDHHHHLSPNPKTGINSSTAAVATSELISSLINKCSVAKANSGRSINRRKNSYNQNHHHNSNNNNNHCWGLAGIEDFFAGKTALAKNWIAKPYYYSCQLGCY